MNIKRLRKKLPPKLSLGKRVVLYLVTVAASALCLLNVLNEFLPELVEYLIYTVTGCVLALSCCYIVFDIKYLMKHRIKPLIRGNHVTYRFTNDYRFRTIITTISSFVFNLFYALLNGFYGIWYRSAWFGSLAAYYMVLSLMRFLAVNYERKLSGEKMKEKERKKEQTIYRRCGMLLALITLVLGGAIISMIGDDVEKSYPGMLIYAIAAYTFYRITISTINVIKVKKFNSPLLTAIRYIGYSDALVSLLSLQMAMFTSFYFGEKQVIRIFNAITGTTVCVIIFMLSIMMMRSDKTNRKPPMP